MGWLFKDETKITSAGLRALQKELDEIYGEVERDMEEIAKEEQKAHAAIAELHAAFERLRERELRFYDAPTSENFSLFERTLQAYATEIATYNRKKVAEDHWFGYFKRHEKKLNALLIKMKQRRAEHINLR